MLLFFRFPLIHAAEAFSTGICPAEGDFSSLNIINKLHKKFQLWCRYTQIRAIDYDLRRNRLLSIKVSRYTEIVLKNVLSESKILQVHSNSRGSYLLGISVSQSTETVLKNVLTRSYYHLYINLQRLSHA